MDQRQAIISAGEVLINEDQAAAKRIANYVLDLPTSNAKDAEAVEKVQSELHSISGIVNSGDSGEENAASVAGSEDA